MSKSTLSITIREMNGLCSENPRTIKVPCRLPEAFNFKVKEFVVTAIIGGPSFKDCEVEALESDGPFGAGVLLLAEAEKATARAESILTTIKAMLGITGPVPPGSPLPAIALAYEAECAAYEAQAEAFIALPPAARFIGMVPPEPSAEVATGIYSPAARMLAKYVEHVVEQAAKVKP